MWIVRALMLGLLLAAVGCGGGDAEEARQTTSLSGATSMTTEAPCGEEDAEAITLTTKEGTELTAALVGDGEVGCRPRPPVSERLLFVGSLREAAC